MKKVEPKGRGGSVKKNYTVSGASKGMGGQNVVGKSGRRGVRKRKTIAQRLPRDSRAMDKDEESRG